jgi:hypothetical protein
MMGTIRVMMVIGPYNPSIDYMGSTYGVGGRQCELGNWKVSQCRIC